MIKMNRNKEYRLKRKAQRKDYIIQDKNLKLKTMYYQNKIKKDKIEQLQQKNNQLKEVIEEVRKHNNQIIKDTKDFYRPTEDKIYSGDTLIDLAETNIQILDKIKGELENE